MDKIDKNNLHHAYLIEGEREAAKEEIFKLLKTLGIKTEGNADMRLIEVDTFKIEDARNLKSLSGEKGFSEGRKVFIISANSFLHEAQNGMLKLFEEPIPSTHFFLIVPDANTLLKTFLSRFFLIRQKDKKFGESQEAEDFIQMTPIRRIDFIKNLIAEGDDDEEEINLNSTRARALKLLNGVEAALYKKPTEDLPQLVSTFEHIFKVREFLRMPGSSTKSLMESLALVIPSV